MRTLSGLFFLNCMLLTSTLVLGIVFFELYAFIILTCTIVLGINYFVIITRPLVYTFDVCVRCDVVKITVIGLSSISCIVQCA